MNKLAQRKAYLGCLCEALASQPAIPRWLYRPVHLVSPNSCPYYSTADVGGLEAEEDAILAPVLESPLQTPHSAVGGHFHVMSFNEEFADIRKEFAVW